MEHGSANIPEHYLTVTLVIRVYEDDPLSGLVMSKTPPPFVSLERI